MLFARRLVHLVSRCRVRLIASLIVFSFAGISSAAAQIILSPSSLPAGTQGQFYDQTVTASGGVGPYTYTITSGSLPAGLSLTGATGEISGTPTTTGISNFTIRATDSTSATGSRSYSIAVGTFSLTLLPNTLPNGSQGTAYNQTITAVGGNAPYTFSVSSGSLPNGLTLTSGGVLSGTPTAGGSFGFIIQAADTDGNTGFRPYTITVAGNTLTINPPTLPNASQGIAYNQTVTASGGVAPYTYSISAGSLPNGLSLNPSTGAITGTPTVSGPFNFTVRAVDSNGDFGTRSYTVNVGSASLTINPATLPNGTVSVAYNHSVTASGGTGPYTYSLSSGSLPTGLSLNTSTGAITGTPSAAGTYNFTIGAVDSVSNSGSRSYTVNIGTNSLTVNPASLPNGNVGTPYNQAVSASGGTGPYTYALSSGSLPAGLTLNGSTGAITGTPSSTGTSNFTVQATDSIGNTGSRAYAVTINLAPLTINPATLPNGTVGVSYNQTVTASGGTAPYTYALTSGALPSGLSLNPSTGAITGTPSAGGSYTFTIQATDTTPNTGSRSYTVNIGTNSLTLNPSSLPNGSQGTPYSQTVVASGGTGPYAYSLAGGSLPAGLSLSPSSGAITGTPSGGGMSNFTVQAIDSLGNIGSRAYAVNIGTNSVTVNPATLPNATQNHAYSQTVSGSGGTAPYVFSITVGSLPVGLSLNPASGAITGTPTTLGVSTFTIRAVDSLGNFGTRAYSLSTTRVDPTTDPEVRGIIESQVNTARRFVTTQTSNVSRHLENLHDGFDNCLADNISVIVASPDPVAPAWSQRGDVVSMPGTGFYQQGAYAYPGTYAYPGATPQAGSLPFGRQPRDPRNCNDRWSSFSFWADGSLEFGKYNSAGQLSNRFNTAGITGGADLRLGTNAIVGAAVGYASDRSDIGQIGSRSDGQSRSAMLYATYRVTDNHFVDAIAGYSGLSFDNNRVSTLDGSMLTGSRTGSTWFGSIGISANYRRGAYKVTPYVRAEYLSAQLDGYAERGATDQALTYGAAKFTSTSAVAGLRGSYDIATGWGSLGPTARVEYRRAFDGSLSQPMFYTDLGPSTPYALALPSQTNQFVTGTLGFHAQAGNNLYVDAEYGASWGTGAFWSQMIRAGARLAF